MARIIEWNNNNEQISFEECMRLAHKYKDEANYEVALKYYNKAQELNPYYCSIYFERSSVYKNLGMNDEALLDSKIHQYLYNEYEYATNDGKNVDFMPALRLQIQAELYQQNYLMDIDFMNFDNSKMNTQEESCINMFQNAIDIYTELIKNNPNDGFLLYCRGRCYNAINEYTLALNDFTMSIEFNPHRITTYDYRSYVYRSLNMFDKAEFDERKAEELKAKKYKLVRELPNTIEEFEYLYGIPDDNQTEQTKQFRQNSTKGRKLDL